MNIEFSDPALARLCNSSEAIDRTWGRMVGDDVRASLCVLAASSTSKAYEAHPNVTNEGDKTVYQGRHADVILDLREAGGRPPTVTVDAVDVGNQSIS